MTGKVMFTILVVVIAAAITATVMMDTSGADAADETAANTATKTESQTAQDQPTAATTAVGISVGNLAPDWTLKDAHGQTHSLRDYRGEVVVMDFWATWCMPCRAVMPDLQAFHEMYESRGVNVIGMNGSERGGDPVKFMADHNYTYEMMLNSERIMGAYGVRGIPAIYVIGVDGTILYKKAGAVPNLDDQLAKIVEPHLQEHGM